MQSNGSGNGSRLPAIAPKPPPVTSPSQALSLLQENAISSQMQLMDQKLTALIQQQTELAIPQVMQLASQLGSQAAMMLAQSQTQLAETLGKLVQREGEYFTDEAHFSITIKEKT